MSEIEYEALDVLSAVVRTNSCKLRSFHGVYDHASNNYFLQLFDAKAVPTNGAVPKRRWPLYAAAPFGPFSDDLDISLSVGMVFAVSSTEDTLTIAAAGNEIDLFVDGEAYVDETGWTTVGDYTTGAAGLQVWAEADGPKKLTRLEFTYLSGGGGSVWAFIYATDAGTANTYVQVIPLTPGVSNDFSFGDDGFVPFHQTAAGVKQVGCFIALSLSGESFSALSTNEFAIKTSYKA